MQPKFTILYAYRNRDIKRVKLSLLSLQKQTVQNFKVQFIDYGSTENYANNVKDIVAQFPFATYHYIAHKGLLWNKSKALNYGIFNVKTEYIVTADVDLLFSENFIKHLESLAKPTHFSLFKIGYLPKEITPKKIKKSNFELLKPKFYGVTFGVGLFSKEALLKVKGLDTFFHFYGSEDEDLNNRLKTAGYQLSRSEDNLLLHQWHTRYPKKKDKKLSITPRVLNIQRVNQRHFLWQKEEKITIPNQSEYWNQCYLKTDYKTLMQPHETRIIYNIKAQIIHFLNYEINTYKGKILKVVFKEAENYNSIKFKIKKILHKNTQPHLSLKAINDQVLHKIIFNYKDYNYNYKISDDLKEIEFTIDLRNKYNVLLA